MWGSPLSGTPWSSTEESSSAGCQTLGDGVWLGLQNFYATWLGRHHPSSWCDHGLGSNSRMPAESWLLFLFYLFTFLGWSEQAPTVEWSGGWVPSCRLCGPVVPSPGPHVSISLDLPSQHQIRADWFYHLAVAGSCGALRVLSRPDRRE